MPLLDKISNYAQKTKDNVISKTFLSKDKRLGQSISENVKLNDIYFEKVSTYGLKSTISLVAFDCVASLLAVADDANVGYIKVFGKGISSTVKLPQPTGIKYLEFKTGEPILVVIDKSNTIITIDLSTKLVRHSVKAPEIITSQAYCRGTDWLFLGYANGYIDVFDIVEGVMTPYQIPDLLDNDKSDNIKNYNHIVVDLQMHPSDLNTLLIGYETTLFIWNIRESSIRRTFSLKKHSQVNLTCLAWSPSGTRFVGGYDDGSIHVWDARNEQKPIFSRQLSSDQAEFTDPVFQIEWYMNDTTQKSFIIAAGGLNSNDVQGLNVLEFDLEGEPKEPKKQTMMPLPNDLSHFLILSSNPYYLGMRNPMGIAIVSIDHQLNVYSLEEGFPPLKLPPAFEFIKPRISNACYIPQLPRDVFKTLTTITVNDRMTRYLPLTGGVAGPTHVYHIESSDLLLTVHQGEMIRFWDASYTALRPLSHLTIHCLDALDNENALLCCVDINKKTGTFTVGFNDGSIVIYEYQGDNTQSKLDYDPKFVTRNEAFINSCDETLKEISQLLQDMGNVSDSEQQVDEINTNPFLGSDQGVSDSFSTNPWSQPSFDENNNDDDDDDSVIKTNKQQQQQQTCTFSKFKQTDNEIAGFYASLKISLGSTIKSVISTGESIIAVATENGTLNVIDIYRQMVIFSCSITDLDYQSVFMPPTIEENVKELQNPPSITTIHFFNTYSSFKVMTISTQLFVGLSNGNVYQFDLSMLEKGLTITLENLKEYLVIHRTTPTPVLEIHMVDMRGKSTLAIETIASNFTDNSIDSESIENASTTTTTTTTTTLPPNVASKRMTAIGKSDYKQQDNPHFIVVLSPHSVSTYLSGYNVKLYKTQLNKEVDVICGEIIQSNESVCLCLLLNNGKLLFYSLPTLEFMLEMNMPNNCMMERLQEASLCSDGRVVFWTGKYELEQYSILHKPNFDIGESVILFDAHKTMPPHPSLVAPNQRGKKTWFDSVTEAFQKDAFTLQELDELMGRLPREDPNEVRRQKIEAYKAKMAKSEESPSKGPDSVFTQLGNKMNERGERLNELDKKFQDLNDASGNFLKAVKDLNERQARKKWWEF